MSLSISPILGEVRDEDVRDVDNGFVCDTGETALVAIVIIVNEFVVFVAAAQDAAVAVAVFVLVFTCPIVVQCQYTLLL